MYLVVSLNSGATTLSQETSYFQEKLTQKRGKKKKKNLFVKEYTEIEMGVVRQARHCWPLRGVTNKALLMRKVGKSLSEK